MNLDVLFLMGHRVMGTMCGVQMNSKFSRISILRLLIPKTLMQVVLSILKDICIIPPNSFVLARTLEYFKIPRDVLTICLGKSTYARCGIIVNVTPLEPEWEGHVTLEFSNTTPLPAKIYANEGVAQMLFFQSDEVCQTSYKDRGGNIGDKKALLFFKLKPICKYVFNLNYL